jgi:flagellin-like protein
MKNLRLNAKALSPVVASLILIAITVSVSIATAAWLGSMSMSHMKTGAITVTNVQFTGASGQPTNTIVLSLKNTGTQVTTVEMVKINEERFFFNSSSGQDTTYAATETKDLTLNNVGWLPAYTYTIQIFGDQGQTLGASQATTSGA